MNKKILLAAVSLFTVIAVQSQSANKTDYPKVGQPVQNHQFTDLDNYSAKTFQLSDFHGKWLVMDFWSRYCGGCIASFPKMNAFHQKFKDKVQLVMIGLRPDSVTRDLYFKMKQMHHLKFTVAFDEPSHEKYDIHYLPTIFVVNPEGVIVAKTTSISEDQMNDLLDGKLPPFKRSFSAHEFAEYDKNLPLLTTGQLANGGTDTSFLFRSMLCKYTYDLPYALTATIVDSGNHSVMTGRVEVAKHSLADLYRLAYFGNIYWGMGHWQYGKYSRDLILEIKDSTDFIADLKTLKGLYAYSLIIPASISSPHSLMKAMQADLSKYFGYEVSIEKRDMPAFHLVVTNKSRIARLKTKGGPKKYLNNHIGGSYLGFSITNQNIDNILSRFYQAIPGSKSPMPLLDKTGIAFNCDISLNGNMLSLQNLNKMLEYYGLQLIETTEPMKTIVIREKENKEYNVFN